MERRQRGLAGGLGIVLLCLVLAGLPAAAQESPPTDSSADAHIGIRVVDGDGT